MSESHENIICIYIYKCVCVCVCVQLGIPKKRAKRLAKYCALSYLAETMLFVSIL